MGIELINELRSYQSELEMQKEELQTVFSTPTKLLNFF